MENKKYWLNKSMFITDGGKVKQLLNGEVVPEHIIKRWESSKTKSGKTELETRIEKCFVVDSAEKLEKIANPAVPSTTDKRGEELADSKKAEGEGKTEGDEKTNTPPTTPKK